MLGCYPYHDVLPKVALRSKTTLDLYVRTSSDTVRQERALLAWYCRRIKAAIPSLITKWEAITGVQVADWGVKRMKAK